MADLAVINGAIFNGTAAELQPGTIRISEGIIVRVDDGPTEDGVELLGDEPRAPDGGARRARRRGLTDAMRVQ